MPRRLQLREVARSASLLVLEGVIPATGLPVALAYATRTGAVARIAEVTVGSFDREHREIVLPPSAAERRIQLQVERHALPTNALPSRAGLRWWWLNRRADPRARRHATLREAPPLQLNESAGGVALWGHSHLDVAWLWTYEEAARKAVRTFANALGLIARDASFIFAQSQPQLYAFVRQSDPALFAAVQAAVASGNWDPDIAAMWVEPDCNCISGESLLRQMLFANRYCKDAFGSEPTIAWLPDSFGFARTLPTLLTHCGIRRFATTKLMWNDTNPFEHTQFIWRGPDGSEVIAALIASYEGGIDAGRVDEARRRDEPLVVGYGDGGGGPTAQHLGALNAVGVWERPRRWFERLEAKRSALPLHDDELYLEYHRGVQTTHHDAKSNNAGLERALSGAEEQVAWCMAIHAAGTAALRSQLDAAWEIALRNQFHDVLPGTSVAAVYEDSAREYARAFEILGAVESATASALPRRPAQIERPVPGIEPRLDGDGYILASALLRARISRDGIIHELALAGRSSVVAQANLLAFYADRPKKWDAWNIDDGYQRGRRAAKPQPSAIVDGGIEIPFLIGRSRATMRIELAAAETFLRVELAVNWQQSRTLLRCENWLPLQSAVVDYGVPHGTVRRSAGYRTAQERARFEVPGQRYAAARDGSGAGLAIFALDTYGWDARTLPAGGLRIGHSLLRSPRWPDPGADRGEQHLAWAYAPLYDASLGEIERRHERFACAQPVRLFSGEDDGILAVACKPAQDGRGVILRVRECNGSERPIRLRCGARMRRVSDVDGLERAIDGRARIEGEQLISSIGPYGIRSFRVEF